MQICIYDNAEQAGIAAALVIAAQLTQKPNSVLGLATGSSPVPTYRELVRLYRVGLLDFSKASTYNLDEYVGIPVDHPCSYHRFMQEHLFDHVNLRPEATHVPDGLAADLPTAGKSYDAAIEAAGGLDLQLLGIGRNGHIGFNEPGPNFINECHVTDLTRNTIEANKRFFDSADEVPRQAITMGIGGIIKARQIVLIASGSSKAQAIHDTIYGEITPYVQASILQTHHHVTLLLDREAASML